MKKSYNCLCTSVRDGADHFVRHPWTGESVTYPCFVNREFISRFKLSYMYIWPAIFNLIRPCWNFDLGLIVLNISQIEFNLSQIDFHLVKWSYIYNLSIIEFEIGWI